ncbi:MAG TPA: carbon-nitrogen hydrolase family protein [Gemmatimonadaceae bacterium]|nr:carbon-nitrogen hydrolase family protein [Gemmatimonadaceae bacterium]
MTRLTVAIAQPEAVDPGSAMHTCVRYARLAAEEGAGLVAFPETWLPGYPIWLDVCRDVAVWDHAPVKDVFARYAATSIVVGGSETEQLAALARELGLTIVIGVCERVSAGRGNGTLYNSLLTFTPDGRLANHHRKLVPTYTERMVWGHGDSEGLQAVDTPAGRIGGLICWEHWMPLARQALHDSGETIHVAVWPTVHEMHQIASRHYAFEGRCFVLAAGAVMRARALPKELERHPDKAPEDDSWVMRGGSAIIAPNGSYLAGPIFEQATLLVTEIDLDDVRREQMTLDVSGHYARPDCFDFTVRSEER